MDDDPESKRQVRKYFIALISAGVATWVVGLCIGALMLLIVGGSLAVAGACGWLVDSTKRTAFYQPLS